MKLAVAILFCVGTVCARDWWESGNFYQIYPRSFRDSDGDGIGDLNGIAEKLPYLKEIGIDGAWVSPIFKSPMVDFGYDTADYYSIHPEYGTMEDFENLMKRAKEVGVKIILDFVPNHTSDQNEWFKKSIDGIPPYDNYYVWHDGIKNSVTGKMDPPSNWLSAFRYSAWEWNDVRQQFYLHQFATAQPDLNYRNPDVVKEMKNVIKFWLKKGVSGFRIDAIPFMFEIEADPISGGYKDEPLKNSADCPDSNDFCYLQHIYTQDQPETYDMLYQWRALTDEFKKEYGGDTRILMTEAYTSLENTIRFYGDGNRNGSQIPFNFELISYTNVNSTATKFNEVIDSWLDNMPTGVYANWVMGNHDNRRIASRYGKDRADLFNIMLQTLPGMAITYNGEELAMTDVFISWDETVDPQACNANQNNFNSYSRDPARTPFQWDASLNSGFSTNTETWLPVSEDYKTNNVLMQERAPVSHLQVFKKLTKVRREPSFRYGTLDKKLHGGDIILYKREKAGSDIYAVILNFGTKTETLNLKSFFPNIGNKVEIITGSVQLNYNDGAVVDSDKIVSQGGTGIVVVSVK